MSVPYPRRLPGNDLTDRSEGFTSIWNNAILFASGKNRLGILLITRDRLDAAPIAGSGPLGRVII